MTIKIGPKGYVNALAPGVGPKRLTTIVSFTGVAAAGPVAGTHFPVNASKKGLRAVIDVTDGKARTAEFSDTGCVVGNLHLTQLDTGASGHVCWAIFTDTGT